MQTVVANLLARVPTSQPAGIVQFRILLTDVLITDTGNRGNEASEKIIEAVSFCVNMCFRLLLCLCMYIPYVQYYHTTCTMICFIFDVQLRLYAVNDQPLLMEGNITATVYSLESVGDNSSEIVVTVVTNSKESPDFLTQLLAEPLGQRLQEFSNIDPSVTFRIIETERFGMLNVHW